MAKSANGVGGKKNPNKDVTVSKKAASYKGGISKAPAGATKSATKYSGGKATPPKGAIPASKK